MKQDSIPVHSLIGKNGLEFYLTCLYSLQFFSKDPVHLVIHSDGSLDEHDFEKIKDKLGEETKFIHKSDADEQVAEEIKSFPNAFKLRKNSIWGIELFDYHILEPSQFSFWCDADVRFFRPFSGLFTHETTKNNCVFIKDTAWHAYTFLPKHFYGKNKLAVCAGINTGLNLLDKKFYDLEFIDWFLGQEEFFRIPEWVVPSCYAALGGRCQSSYIAPNQLVNLYPNAKISSQTFAGHFLSSYRKDRMNEFNIDWENASQNLKPIKAEILPCSKLGAFQYSGNLIKRKIATRLGIYL